MATTMAKRKGAARKGNAAARAARTGGTKRGKVVRASAAKPKKAGGMGSSSGTARTPAAYLAAIRDEARRADMEELDRLIRKTVPDLEPSGSTTGIGYGTYHYRYATGREGDCAIIALSSRAQYISLYVMGVEGGRYIAESYRSKFPKANVGKCCVRFKRLEDVDKKTLVELIRAGAKAIARSVRTGATTSS